MGKSLLIAIGAFVVGSILWMGSGRVPAEDALILLDPPVSAGPAILEVRLGAVAARCGWEPDWYRRLQVESPDGRAIPSQFCPAPRMDDPNADLTVPPGDGSGTLFLDLPDPAPDRLIVRPASDGAASTDTAGFDGHVDNPHFAATHLRERGGFFSSLRIRSADKDFPVRFADRVYHRDWGSFLPASDAEAEILQLGTGPIGTAVRTRARYKSGNGEPESQPWAVYDWLYFHGEPWIWVRGRAAQGAAFAWDEHHFLELQFREETAAEWLGGEPVQRGRFERAGQSHRVAEAAVALDGRSALGLASPGHVIVYDSPGGDAHYVQSNGDVAWQPWEFGVLDKCGWLFGFSDDDPAARLQSIRERLPRAVQAAVTTEEIHRRIVSGIEKVSPVVAGLARQLETVGRWEDASAAAEGRLPDRFVILSAGRAALVCERTEDGVLGPTLHDAADGRAITGRRLPLFTVHLRSADGREDAALNSDRGWQDVSVTLDPANRSLALDFKTPTDSRLSGIGVVARASADEEKDAIRWTLEVRNSSESWSIHSVRFPQTVMLEPGADGWLVYPKAAGVAEQGAWRQAVDFSGRYPSGWVTMQFVAAYPHDGRSGFYLGVHDPFGGTKEMRLRSLPKERLVEFSWEQWAGGMGTVGNGFRTSGKTVWRLFDGDWFDAALIYRDWVRREARWYPELGSEGREDTPPWMRELSIWALGGGAPGDCVDSVRKFAEYFGVPTGFHWYNWHQIPFDNDYPHYFPTKEGFADGVRELQAHGVHVMPYINGRLWDTRDRGLEDFEFTSKAKPAVSKDEKGEPYVETYNSKEEDGSPVRLGVMCPSTPLWQEAVREIVLRLFSECGVHGVYIDQIAAAAPTLCFDPSHGHPLGGGHWWTESYWRLLEELRRAMPDDRMITTECNAEPYIRWFDGYLTWHWQYPNQVPLFPAVYGGSVQMFGRFYGGTGSGLLPSEEAGRNRDTALRMRAAQQLVFGEQIGWINPGVLQEENNAAFLKKLVTLRARTARYFYAGEMARPPRLLGDIPKIHADWQWGGTMWVTTDAVFRGCWVLPREKRSLVLAVNAAEESVPVRIEADAVRWGLPDRPVTVRRLAPEPAEAAEESPPTWGVDVVLPPASVYAWELQSADR
mgnify:FL=1